MPDGFTIKEPELRFGRLRVFQLGEVLQSAPRDYVLKGIMSPAEMSVWVGTPKCGKSFLLLHVAYAVAQGRSVFGRRVKPVSALYVAAEGEAGIALRLRALRDRHGDAGAFSLIAQPADLLHDKADLGSVIEAAQYLNAKLIVVDTLYRAMAGGDENGPTDMGQFIANIGALREATGAHVAIVHHGTKESGGTKSRGHSSLIGAADAVIEVTKAEDGTRTAKVAMAKDDPDGAAMAFRLDVVEFEPDPDGDPVTTCIVEEHDTPELQSGSKLTRAEWQARTILADLLVAEGRPLPIGGGYPNGLYGVSEQRWRDECKHRRLTMSEKADSHQKAFKRASEGLLAKAVAAARDGWVWLTYPEQANG